MQFLHMVIVHKSIGWLFGFVLVLLKKLDYICVKNELII